MKTSSRRVKFFALAQFAILLLCAPTAKAQSYSLTPLWSIAPQASGYEWVSTNHTHRGLALNPVNGNLLTVTRYPVTNAAVYILSGQTGEVLGGLSTNGVFMEINFPLNVIGVADDGAIYACNLTVDSTNTATGNTGPFRIYRWANESAEPTVAYIGDPSNSDTNNNHRRFGDSFAVRGSGLNTEILAGTRAGRIAIRFITSDGINFTAQKLDAPQLLGVSAMTTIAFGASNTFFVKAESSPNLNHAVQHFSYDGDAATATLLRGYTNAALIGGPLGFDVSRKLLGVVRAVSHEFRLFKLTDSGFVQQDAVRAFPTNNSNGNFTGSVVFGGDKLFALESNNGIMAFTISTNALAPFSTATTVNASTVTLTWPSSAGFIYQPQYKDALTDANWGNLGIATNGTGADIITTDALGSGTRFYRIRAE